MKRLRWWLIHQLDRSRRYCWADLVTWALRYTDEPLPVREGARCAAETPECWCGKFRQPLPANAKDGDA